MTALCRSVAIKGYDAVSRLVQGAEMVEIRGIGLLDSMTLLRKSLKHLNLQ